MARLRQRPDNTNGNRKRALASIVLCAMAAAALFLPGCYQVKTDTVTTQTSGVSVSFKVQYYGISGNTADGLRSQMSSKGPSGYDGYTNWNVRWSYPVESSGTAYVTGPLTVVVDVEETLPEWTPAAGAPADLVAKWNAYIAALKLHEDGHKDIGIEAGNAVMNALKSVPPQPSPADLRQAADAAAAGALGGFSGRDETYDDTTGHGATQGARFP